MIKKTIRERSTLGIICEWIWGASVIAGTSYLVFWEGHSGWWFLLAIFLMSASTAKKVTTIEEE